MLSALKYKPCTLSAWCVDQNRREMVIAMYNNNATLEFISSVSSLSISEIEKIINDNKKLIKK